VIKVYSISAQCDSLHLYKQDQRIVWICRTIHIQNLAWCENPHPRNPRIEFKFNGQLFITQEKVFCTPADMAMHDTNDWHRLTPLHIHVDLAKNIDDNLNKFKQESMENFHICNC